MMSAFCLQGCAALHVAAFHGHVNAAAELLQADNIALSLQQTQVSMQQSNAK